jgi:glycosyltransferase involved in cell wall biosynthesis
MNLWADFLTNTDLGMFKWTHYFPIYEKHFERFRNLEVTVMEIGVFNGGSLKMWKRFLGPYATVVGIDINPDCIHAADEQVHVRIGNQTDPVFLDRVIAEFGIPDIIVDDGSHLMGDMSFTFDHLYPKMLKNSVYLVEDLHTAYWSEYGGGLGKPDTFIEKTKKLIDQLNADHTRGALTPNDFTQKTSSIHFYDSVIVFEKQRLQKKSALSIGKTLVAPISVPQKVSVGVQQQEPVYTKAPDPLNQQVLPIPMPGDPLPISSTYNKDDHGQRQKGITGKLRGWIQRNNDKKRRENSKLSILFIHGAWWNQFSLLHRYFQETQAADSLFLTSEKDIKWYRENDPKLPKNIFSYTPDGELNENTYYYSSGTEQNARNGVRILEASKAILAKHEIDLVVNHAILGAPHMLFDEISVPIVSYVEFPSYRHHQWDPKYPPDNEQRYHDKYDEMLNYYAALKSDLVITPSQYAKNMFPKVIQKKIIAQMEGFDPKEITFNSPELLSFKKEPGYIYIGFLAANLTSEKGFEQFIIISKRLSEINKKIRYVLLGDSTQCYGFEGIFLARNVGGNKTFKDYLFSKYGVDESLYTCTGRIGKEALSTAIHHMDLFLYPLQFGSANWGLYEILLRGKIIVASNKCFLPEVIANGRNGFLVDYDDIERWVSLSNEIANNLMRYKHIEQQAAESGKKFYIENVASKYIDIFRSVCNNQGKPATSSTV